MNDNELDQLDSKMAEIVGPAVAVVNALGRAQQPDRRPYQPTRDPVEAMRLLQKYIARVARLAGGWVAVDLGGRASRGSTLPIAVCNAVIDEHQLRVGTAKGMTSSAAEQMSVLVKS